jgi:hypothetical protein
VNKPDQDVECSYCYYGSCEQYEYARRHVGVLICGALWRSHVCQKRRSVPALASCESGTEEAEHHQAERGGFRHTHTHRLTQDIKGTVPAIRYLGGKG